MTVVHFYEKNSIVLSQLRHLIPSVGENIKVKGRKAKVLSVNKIDDNLVRVQLEIEQVAKKEPAKEETKKKKK
ncbi:hypothetical protein BKP37_08530 [Anaerobacillus alkalilacustris]|uniref:Uncharacterized protein n=1 Tax=Anaerobacillus alkalilacustris TaxID=393763 RepID=A0A1S2LPD2_9BACI|nr:hypothetical protein [Anaerobacillus alkalilacustris]OIJ14382.1 hypothetical protein BKP37_08530 [Anaerobacillus alkalilacustris]